MAREIKISADIVDLLEGLDEALQKEVALVAVRQGLARVEQETALAAAKRREAEERARREAEERAFAEATLLTFGEPTGRGTSRVADFRCPKAAVAAKRSLAEAKLRVFMDEGTDEMGEITWRVKAEMPRQK